MPTYIFEAIDSKGSLHRGEMEAADKNSILEFLHRDNLTAINIAEKGLVSGPAAYFHFFQRVSALEKIMLTRHLAAIIRAGLNLLEAMNILIEDNSNPTMKKILETAKFNLEKGQPLSTTFIYYRQYFSPLFSGLIKAGEASGNLEKNLGLLSNQMLREYDLRKKIKGAMMYPIILLVAVFIVLVFLFTFVLPRLNQVFFQSGVKLPWLTKSILSFSQIFSSNIILTILFALAIPFSLIYMFKSVRGREFLIRTLSRIPLFNNLIQKVALVRMTQSFHNVLNSGLPIMEVLDLTADSVGNEYYSKAILEIKEEVRRGGGLAKSFESRRDLFPRLLVSMTAVGERTGTLENIFLSASQFYDEEVDRTLKDVVSLLEPILLLLMGIIVGGVALSILLPIYQLIGGLQ